MMIQLTDWESGRPIFVNENKMDVVRRLPASVSDFGNGPTELGERTKIQVGHDIFLVRETPEEVMQAAAHC
jgi:hypothetical protein